VPWRQLRVPASCPSTKWCPSCRGPRPRRLPSCPRVSGSAPSSSAVSISCRRLQSPSPCSTEPRRADCARCCRPSSSDPASVPGRPVAANTMSAETSSPLASIFIAYSDQYSGNPTPSRERDKTQDRRGLIVGVVKFLCRMSCDQICFEDFRRAFAKSPRRPALLPPMGHGSRRSRAVASGAAFCPVRSTPTRWASSMAACWQPFSIRPWVRSCGAPSIGRCVTLRLTLDYLSPARVGDWLEATGELVGQDEHMVHVRGRLYGPAPRCTRRLGDFALLSIRRQIPVRS
jgi:hypothetical protein